MTNDEIERRANQIVTNWRQDSAVCESISLVNYVRAAIHLAVEAALEEAAKVASNRVMYWIEQPIFTDTDNRFNSAREAEARAIELAIRALKPVTP